MAPERPRLKFVTEDSFAALVRLYFAANPKWSKYSSSTQTTWKRELTFAAHPDCLGAISLHEIRPSLVQAFMDGIADRPGKQGAALRALNSLKNGRSCGTTCRALSRLVLKSAIRMAVTFHGQTNRLPQLSNMPDQTLPASSPLLPIPDNAAPI
jgi:hypothetical protein